jgi:hypothetical protein
MSRTEQLHLGAFIRSGVLFTLMVIIFQIDQFIKSYDTIHLNLPLSIPALFAIWTTEYYYTGNNVYSLLVAIAFFLCSLGQ